MRLKLLFENIKHHLVLSFFILFTSIIIVTSITLAVETNSFLNHVTSDEYRVTNHDMDIIIKSNTGLSLKGTRGDNLEYDNSYERRNSFYNVTLLATANSNTGIIQIFEGSNEDINLAFDKDLTINENEIVITSTLASNLEVSNNDFIDLYIGDKTIKYKVVGIIDGTGIYTGDSAFITGYHVAEHYALRKMYNLIMLDVKEDADYDNIYNHLHSKYHAYSVIDINDKAHIDSMSTSSLDEMLAIVTLIFLIILVILLKMFSQKTKKQKDYFVLIGKNNYYKIYQLIAWILIITLSIIGSIILSNLFIKILLRIHNCRFPYSINKVSYLLGVIPLLIVLFCSIFTFNNMKINFNKIYVGALFVFIILLTVLMIAFRNTNIFSLLLLLLSILLCLLVVEIVFRISKYVLPYKEKLYIYDLNKKTMIFRLLQFIYIFIIVIVSMILSTLFTYDTQIAGFNDLIKLDNVVVTKTDFGDSLSYDKIQVDNNINLKETNLNVVLALTNNQYEQYLDYPSLTEEENEKFNTDKKYIILPKFYKNTYHYEIGDSVELLINEQTESFEILKFVNHIYYKMAIVNYSDNMYYGYVIDSNNLSLDLVNKFIEE